MLRLYYEGTEITDFVTVRRCLVRDTAGERCDGMEIEFFNAGVWNGWGPAEDERIRAVLDSYDTGTLYVNTVQPEDGFYRIFATALPCRARRRMSRSYAELTLEEIVQSAAMASGMRWALYGLDGGAAIPYIQQGEESCAAFLSRLLRLEGAALKCVNGKYAGIGLLWAQELRARKTLRLTAEQKGAAYRRGGEKLRGLRVRTPYADASAEDTSAADAARTETVTAYPAKNGVQAGRWARGLLLDRNRRCEEVRLRCGFDADMEALVRIDVEGGTAADGKWLVASAEHDLLSGTSEIWMHRCIETIV